MTGFGCLLGRMFDQVICLRGISKLWDVGSYAPEWNLVTGLGSFTPFHHTCLLTYFFDPQCSFFFHLPLPSFSPLSFSCLSPSLPLLPSLVCCYCTYFLLMKCLFPPDCVYVFFKKAKFLWKDLWNLYHMVPIPSVLLENVYFFLPQVREVNFVSDALVVEALKKRYIGAIASGWVYLILLVPLAHKPPHCGRTA